MIDVRDDGKITYELHEPAGVGRVLPRQGSSGGRIIGNLQEIRSDCARLRARDQWRARPEQALEFGAVQAVAAHDAAVEQQHRNVKAVAARQRGSESTSITSIGGSEATAPEERELGAASPRTVRSPARARTVRRARPPCGPSARARRPARPLTGALHLVGDEPHGGRRHLAHRRHLVAVDDGGIRRGGADLGGPRPRAGRRCAWLYALDEHRDRGQRRR